MSTVAVVTRVSPLLVSVLLAERHTSAGALTVLAPDEAAFRELKGLGISPVHLTATPHESWAERDTRFAVLAMPGPLTAPFPGTALPAWKVLAIDRLSFWYGGATVARLAECVGALRHSRLIVGLDLASPLWWGLAETACEAGRPAIGVQCGSVRTREWLDLAPHLPLSELVLRSRADADLLVRHGYAGTVTVSDVEPAPAPVPAPATPERRAALKAGLGIPDFRPAIFVVYESQTEWAFRRWLTRQGTNRTNPPRLLVHPVDAGAKRHLYATAADGLLEHEVMVVDDPELWRAAETVVLFRYREEWATLPGAQVQIQDVDNRFCSQELLAKEPTSS